MSGLSGFNPSDRFTGLAENYAKYRPSYPATALDLIVTRCRLGPSSLLVDVGCGTGISSRLFADRSVPVIGIDPNDDMLARAEAAEVPPGRLRPTYRKGRAEATGLPDGVADGVLAAQAFHWFDPEAALREFRRILKPGGWVVLMWNERDESDPFTAAYGSVIRTAPDTARVEGSRVRAGEVLLASSLFEASERLRFANEQLLDEEGVLGRAFSTSYIPREPGPATAVATALRELLARFQRDGQVRLRYETTVFLARSPASLTFRET
jgi:SAM-dependent methyltransferase